MSDAAPALPKEVMQPLWRAVLVTGGGLILFCLWATFAPLATTITLQGTIVSKTPSLDLQHPYGGAVQDVLVAHHERVEVGQVLLRLDTALQEETRATQISIRERIQQENRDIGAIINALARPDRHVQPSKSSYAIRHAHVSLKAASSLETADNLRQQMRALEAKITHAQQQLVLMDARYNRQAKLASKGVLPREQIDQLQEQILIVRGELEADQASALNLRSQVRQTLEQRELAQIAWEHELVATREKNLGRLDDLQRSILGLTDQIEKAAVRAPVAGVVTSIPVQTRGMYATRGERLLTLAQPLDEAQVTFTIPVKYIDQIQAGMSARLTVPSLPQKLMPKIDLSIEAIALRAETDESGAPIAYRALATGDVAALGDLAAIDGIGPLSEDMPVILTVAVRETTFAQYILGPLLRSFSHAFQD